MKRFAPPAALAFAAAMLAVNPAAAQTEIRISTAAPANAPLTEAFNHIKTRMETKFPGAIKVSVHAASALFRQGTEVPAMQRGNLEMASPVAFEIEAQLPEYGAFGAAYLFANPDQMMKVFRGPIGQEFAADVAAKMGLVLLDTSYLGTRTVGLRMEKAVKVPADLAGVKMRMPPGPAFQGLATALGATAVSMPITEVYLGLKTGAIDGQDNPPALTRDWKFHEVTQQIVQTNHLVQPVFFAIAKPFFDTLTKDQQAELRAAAREAADTLFVKTVKDEAEAIASFKAAGIKVSMPDLEAFRVAVWAQYKKAGLIEKWKPGLVDRIQTVK